MGACASCASQPVADAPRETSPAKLPVSSPAAVAPPKAPESHRVEKQQQQQPPPAPAPLAPSSSAVSLGDVDVTAASDTPAAESGAATASSAPSLAHASAAAIDTAPQATPSDIAPTGPSTTGSSTTSTTTTSSSSSASSSASAGDVASAPMADAAPVAASTETAGGPTGDDSDDPFGSLSDFGADEVDAESEAARLKAASAAAAAMSASSRAAAVAAAAAAAGLPAGIMVHTKSVSIAAGSGIDVTAVSPSPRRRVTLSASSQRHLKTKSSSSAPGRKSASGRTRAHTSLRNPSSMTSVSVTAAAVEGAGAAASAATSGSSAPDASSSADGAPRRRRRSRRPSASANSELGSHASSRSGSRIVSRTGSNDGDAGIPSVRAKRHTPADSLATLSGSSSHGSSASSVVALANPDGTQATPVKVARRASAVARTASDVTAKDAVGTVDTAELDAADENDNAREPDESTSLSHAISIERVSAADVMQNGKRAEGAAEDADSENYTDSDGASSEYDDEEEDEEDDYDDDNNDDGDDDDDGDNNDGNEDGSGQDDDDEDDDVVEEPPSDDEAASARLHEMIRSGNFTYVASKMKELRHVRQQAEEVRERLDLLRHPLVVRAVLEILLAKELQIARAEENGDIASEGGAALRDNIGEIRSSIARTTNVNTSNSVRRALRHSRTLSISLAHDDISNAVAAARIPLEPLAVTLPWLAHSESSSSSLAAGGRQLHAQSHVHHPNHVNQHHHHHRQPAPAAAAAAALEEVVPLVEVYVRHGIIDIVRDLARSLVQWARAARREHLATFVDDALRADLATDSAWPQAVATLERIVALLEACVDTTPAFALLRSRVRHCASVLQYLGTPPPSAAADASKSIDDISAIE